MRTFVIIWLGQMVSLIGSSMTAFAFAMWVWELTHQATSLALFHVFAQIPQIFITPIAGVVVDRFDRKLLMIAGDMVGGLLSLTILLLYISNHLQLWHLYLAFAIKCTFEQLQELAYSVSISTMVSKQQYSHASNLGFLAGYGSTIFAPALAGVLYVAIGLVGILIIDITSFIFAVITILRVHIPQPVITEAIKQNSTNIIQDIRFGFDYIISRPSLLALLTLTTLFWFIHDFGDTIYTPMILERSGNDPKVLGSLASAVGIGGVLGVLLVSIKDGFKHRIRGLLFSMVGASFGRIILGLGRTPLIWIPAQLYSSVHFPLLGSSNDAIWLAKVKPQVQGRVFATRSAILLVISTAANLTAGLLVDYVFEPAMMPGQSLALLFGWIFGTGKGAGMALLYVISSLCLLMVGFSGYAFRILRDVETIVPDHDVEHS